MIICIGESLVDMVGPRVQSGGCPYNTALAAARAGAGSVMYLGRISSDEYGALLLETLVESLVMFDPSLCCTQLPTAIARAQTAEDASVSYDFSLEGTAALAADRDDYVRGLDLAPDADYLFCGSIALSDERHRQVVVDALTADGRPFIRFTDANVRPQLIADMKGYLEFFENYICNSDIVRLSTEDAAALYPGLDESALARRFSDLGVRHFIYTKGSGGASWHRAGGGTVAVPAIKAGIADTIGCGDTFNGAVLCCLDQIGYAKSRFLDDGQIRRILEFASRAAAVNATRPGCDPPTAEEIESLVP